MSAPSPMMNTNNVTAKGDMLCPLISVCIYLTAADFDVKPNCANRLKKLWTGVWGGNSPVKLSTTSRSALLRYINREFPSNSSFNGFNRVSSSLPHNRAALAYQQV